jgi:hypothetical protein
MPFIDFTPGQVLTADQVDLIMRQSVMVFDDAAARDVALSAVLAEGMLAYLKDTNEILKYTGSVWTNIDTTNPGDITAVEAGNYLEGGGTEGDVSLSLSISPLMLIGA